MKTAAALTALTVALAACAQPFEAPRLSEKARERPDLEERLADPARTIAGTVVDSAGRAVEAQVLLVSGESSVSMDTGPNGQFRLLPAGTGTLALHAQTDDGLVAVLPNPRLGRLDHRLTVRLGAELEVAHDSNGGARLAVFHDNRRIVDTPVVVGRLEEWVVPAGEVRVLLYDDEDRTDERRLDVTAGEDASVELSLRPANTPRPASAPR